jgi:thiol-disulfide isomerase/thioredoxin
MARVDYAMRPRPVATYKLGFIMSKTSRQTFGMFLCLGAIVAGVPLLWSLGAGGTDERAGLPVGATAPEIKGGGWLNGEAPKSTDLKGKVIFVNAWSLRCPICEKGLPDLVELHGQYKDKGVVFVGLSLDGANRAEDMADYLKKYKANWPNAYDAIDTAKAFKVEYIPGYWVIDRKGIVVWNKSSKEKVGDAIDRALKQST